MTFVQDFSDIHFPRFLQGPFLRTTLTQLPAMAKDRIWVMVPYLIKSDILDSLSSLPKHISIKLYTRDQHGYLPNIKQGAKPALEHLMNIPNLHIFIHNLIHAKIWLIDSKFAVVHSMNGTPFSEYKNFEAGIISNDEQVITEVEEYFKFVEKQSRRIK